MPFLEPPHQQPHYIRLPLSLSDTTMLESFDSFRIMDFIGYTVVALLIIGMFSLSLTCVVGAKDLQRPFFATSTTAIQIGRVSPHSNTFYRWVATIFITIYCQLPEIPCVG